MSIRVHPRHLKKALELLESDPARAWTVGALAAAAGVARRTLHKHFRRFVGRAPLAQLREIRLGRARQELLQAAPDATVTAVATRCGFAHFGRFAIAYRARYAESPSATLRHRRSDGGGTPVLPLLPRALERPAIAIAPFTLIGPAARLAAGMAEQIAAALLRLRWFRVASPERARYHLHGKLRDDGTGRLRATVTLFDVAGRRMLWADHWDGSGDDAFAFEERVAAGVARAVEPALREAEIDRVRAREPEALGAWELAMRALPGVLSYEAEAEAHALELLERAIALAPQDPLPLAMAAWCHGVRSCLHLTARPQQEREAARVRALAAASLSRSDALTETMLTSGYTLAHDLATAAAHADRALALNGGSALAWARAGWVSAFSGDDATAIERFTIARAIAPADPQSAVCCFGIASVPFASGRMREAVPWIERGLAEHPNSTWIKAFLAAGYALDNRKDDARQALAAWRDIYPEGTVAQLASGLPFRARLYDHLAEGLESVGLRAA